MDLQFTLDHGARTAQARRPRRMRRPYAHQIRLLAQARRWAPLTCLCYACRYLTQSARAPEGRKAGPTSNYLRSELHGIRRQISQFWVAQLAVAASAKPSLTGGYALTRVRLSEGS